jgi:CMP-N,N'-diacetyllegionaminic acid synthase
MRKNGSVMAIIPARGASKGIPKKNIRSLAGKPLIAYTIEAALKSNTIDKVIVSTDSEEIAEISQQYGAEVPFLRPSHLAEDNTPTLPVIQHAISYLENKEGIKGDIVVILQPTSPLRNSNIIDEAVEKLRRTNCDTVVSVCEVKDHPFWSYYIKNDILSPFYEGSAICRQELPKIYSLNGAVYVIKRDVLIEQNLILGKQMRPIVMAVEESIDIDDFFDLFIAEMVIKYWKGNKK